MSLQQISIDLSADLLERIVRCQSSDGLDVRFYVLRHQFMFTIFHPVQHVGINALMVMGGVLVVCNVIEEILSLKTENMDIGVTGAFVDDES